MESHLVSPKTYRLTILSLLPNTYNFILFVYACIALFLLKAYFIWDLNIVFGVILLPYLIQERKQQTSWRYLAPALLSTGLALFLPVKTLLFIALVFAALLLIESHKGKLNSSASLLLFIISPVFKYVSNVFSFPIRLWLTEKAANFITLIGKPAIAEGNLIKYNGADFSVDQACAGLHMLNISLLLCLFVTAFYQKKTARYLPFAGSIGFIFLTILLNIFSNLIRIPVLVLFNIPEGSFLHNLTGLICLAVYVFIPLLLITKLLFSSFSKPIPVLNNHEIFKTLTRPLPHPLLHLTLFTALLFSFFNLKSMGTGQFKNPHSIKIAGYKPQYLKDGIVKFENGSALIYIKPTPFYAPEHNPMICWSGSGYTFKYIRKEIVNGNEIYTGMLIKGKDKIYTAWWFDNGALKTVNQIKWRWNAAKNNQPFFLVNLNTYSHEHLYKLLKTQKIL